MYPTPSHLELPLTPYQLSPDYLKFGERIRRHVVLWATHLGDDVVVEPGTPVQASGDGEVVWSEMRLGSEGHRNWGGVVIIGHTHAITQQPFYSVYGHMKDLAVKVGQPIKAGQLLGHVAASYTPENGWWKVPHLHFAIYTGPWQNDILPGYKRPEERQTKMQWWHDPQPFIERYNQQTLADAS